MNVKLLASLLARLLVQLRTKSAKDSILKKQPLGLFLFFDKNKYAKIIINSK